MALKERALKLIKFFISRNFWINILFMVLLSLVLILLSFRYLKGFTDHNQSITVPELKELKLDQVEGILAPKKLKYVVMDSSYSDQFAPGAVIDQSPLAGSKVKEKRKIYLTVNASNPPSVKFPKIVGNSRRQANIILESWGLKLGEEIFVPDPYEDLVLNVKMNGKQIKEGTLIPKGSVIDLVVGDGYGSKKVEVPDLVGLRLFEAIAVLQGIALNPGIIEPDETVKDEQTAYVYYQDPSYDGSRSLKMGEPVKLFITQNMPDLGR